MIKRILSLFLLPLVLVCVFSCGRDNVFTHAELNLPLPKDFYEVEAVNSDLLMTNGEVTVAVTRYSYESDNIPGYLTAEVFADFCLKKSGIDSSVNLYGDIPYFTYHSTETGSDLFCMVTFYSTPYAYFSVMYATPTVLEGVWREQFLAIADGVFYN